MSIPYVAIENNDWKKMLELLEASPTFWAKLINQLPGFQYALAKRVKQLLEEGKNEEALELVTIVSENAKDLS